MDRCEQSSGAETNAGMQWRLQLKSQLCPVPAQLLQLIVPVPVPLSSQLLQLIVPCEAPELCKQPQPGIPMELLFPCLCLYAQIHFSLI